MSAGAKGLGTHSEYRTAEGNSFIPPAEGVAFLPFKKLLAIRIPFGLAEYRGLSFGAKCAWGCLEAHAGAGGLCYPGAPRVAKWMGISVTQARTYLWELQSDIRSTGRGSFLRINLRPGKSSTYDLLWHKCFDGLDCGSVRKAPSCGKKKGQPYRKTDIQTLSENRYTPYRKTDTETVQLNGSVRNGSGPPPSPSSSSGFSAQFKEQTPQKFGASQNGKRDDDGKPKPSEKEKEKPSSGNPDAEQQLLVHYKEQTGEFLPVQTWDRIKIKFLEPQGITVPEFLKLVKTHNLGAAKDPAAMLTYLAKTFRSATTAARAEMTPAGKPETVCELGRCLGRGFTAPNDRAKYGFDFCACRLGRDLEVKFDAKEAKRPVARAEAGSAPKTFRAGSGS